MSNKKEAWKPITIDGKEPAVPYVISSHGRFGVLVDGKVQVRTFKPTAGNYRYNTRQQGKNKAIFLYKEVARAFLKKPASKYKFIIHKDHNYLNDHVENLKWATHEEHRAHTAMSPKSIMAREKKAITRSSHSKVLDEKKVVALKKMIWDPKRKLSFKQLAEQFGVSEMQIYRIKSGEFWYHVRVSNEPLHAKYKRNLSNISFQEKRSAKAEEDRVRKEAAKKTASVNRAAKEKKRKAQVLARKKALALVSEKKLRDKSLKSSRHRKLLQLAKAKRLKEQGGGSARAGQRGNNNKAVKLTNRKKR